MASFSQNSLNIGIVTDSQQGPDCDDDTAIKFIALIRKIYENNDYWLIIPSHFEGRLQNVLTFCEIVGFPTEKVILQGKHDISFEKSFDVVFWIAEVESTNQVFPFLKDDGKLIIQGGIGENSVNLVHCEEVNQLGEKFIPNLPENTLFVPSSTTIKCMPNEMVIKYFKDLMPDLYQMQIRSFIAMTLCRCNTDKIYALGLISNIFGRGMNLVGLVNAYNKMRQCNPRLPYYEEIEISSFNLSEANNYIQSFVSKHSEFVKSKASSKGLSVEEALSSVLEDYSRALATIELMTGVKDLPLLQTDDFVNAGGNLVEHEFTQNPNLKMIATSFAQPLHDLMTILVGLMATSGVDYTKFFENPSEHLLEVMNAYLQKNYYTGGSFIPGGGRAPSGGLWI